MFKRVKVILASFLATILWAAPTSAISLSSLEQISDASESIEINTPEEGYDFDANFLAKNQELAYKATIINDEALPIKIQSVDLNTSEYDFLEYSYDGIAVDDTLESGETKDIIVRVITNSNDTQTVNEDYNLSINYSQITPTPPEPDTPEDTPEDESTHNPETATTAIIKTTTLASVSLGLILIVFIRNKKIRNLVIIFTISSLSVYLLCPNTYAEETKNFNILGKIHFTNIYTVTVNPNGGVYENKTSNTVVTRREGETYHVSEATREHFNFVEWEVNPGELDANDDIEIHADTTIKAKWDEKTYTLTIQPNGGEYLGSSDNWSESYRPGETTSISTPEMEGYDFVNWTVKEGNIGTDGIFTGASIEMLEDITLEANYTIKKFTVTVIPNGGTYHDSTDVFIKTVDWNTDYAIEPISREGFDLKDWTKTIGETTTTLSPDTETINIKEDTTIKANWWSSTFHTVTIIPNGGVYDNSTSPSEYQVRDGEKYTMLEATNDDSLFDYWHYTDSETRLSESEFIVTEDVSLTAEWAPIVARIERTGKLYSSIMAAHAEANPGDITNDTITLLVNTDEVVTNSKQVTLDLNNHTVYGYLTNTTSGNLLLINGIINNCTKPTSQTATTCNNTIANNDNPHGAAIINNGTLTFGYDDYEGEENASEAHIDHDNIRIYGNEYGLEQNGVFNYYDGSIEAQFGLIGGYNKSPWFRKMSDDKDIYFFPFVSKNNYRNCQHIQLESSNLAVSKTINNGEIYYYNLQDNINTSAITGYNIYAVRDFEASYPITVAQGDTINFDIVGYNINLGDDWTNNGTFNITDSKSSDGTGALNYSRTFVNNGTLALANVKLTATSPNNLLNNAGNLTLTESTINSDTSTALELTGENAVVNADNNSTISTSNSNYYAVLNNATMATIYGGNYTGLSKTIENNASKKLVIEGGTYTTNANSADIIENQGILDFNDGNITYDNTTSSTAIYGIHNKNGDAVTTFNGGKIDIRTKGAAYGLYSLSNSLIVNAGDFTIESINGQATGIDGDSGRTYVRKGENATKAPVITVTAKSGAIGISGAKEVSDVKITAVSSDYPSSIGLSSIGTVSNVDVTATNDNYEAYGAKTIGNFNSGTLSASSKNGTAYGIYQGGGKVNGGTITATSEDGTAIGYYGYASNNNYYSSTITGGTITGTVNNNDNYGYGVKTKQHHTLTVTGGNITGTNFGIDTSASSHVTTIGSNETPITKDSPIISGGDFGLNAQIVDFYDGTLIGGTDYINNHSTIRAIPSGADYHIEELNNKQNCWLVAASDWLHNERLNESYNSFEAAYSDKRFQDGDTLQVTRDYSTESYHAKNEHTVILDLDNHTLNFTQNIPNSGKMTIKNGTINNSNITAYAIDNTGELIVDKSEINGTCNAIRSYGNNNKLTISNHSLITVDEPSSNCEGVIHLHQTAAELNDSTVRVETTTSSSYTYGIYFEYSGGSLDINRSTIHVTSKTSNAYGVHANGVSRVSFNSGTLYVLSGTDENDPTTYKSSAYGIVYASTINFGVENAVNNETPKITVIGSSGCGLGCKNSGIINVRSGTINSYGNNGTTEGVHAYTINNYGGSINARTNSGTSKGEASNNINIYGGNISSNSTSGISYGINVSSLDMRGGSVSATKEAGNTKDATGVKADSGSITGGTIYGDTYGLDHDVSDARYAINLGTDDGTLNKDALTITGGEYGINNGYIYFNDGTIIGNAELDYAKDRTSIKAIPAGASYHYEASDDKYKCWLTKGTEFLLNTRLGSKYTSFDEAYNDEGLQSGDTLQVIDNATYESVIPANTSTVILDLNGKTLTISKSILNSGTLTVKDDLGGGILQSNNTSADDPVISNTGTLNITSGTIAGINRTIYTNNGTYNQTGGTVKVSGAYASEAIRAYNSTINIQNSTVSSENLTDTQVKTLYTIEAGASTINITDSNISSYNNNGQAYNINWLTGYSTNHINIYGNSNFNAESVNSSVTNIDDGYVKTAKNSNGNPTFTATAPNGSADAIHADSGSTDNTKSIITDATITVTGHNSCHGIQYANEAKNNTITVTSDNSTAFGLFYVGKATSNTTTVTAKGIAYGIHCRNCTIESGTTTVKSTTENAYGYYSGTSKSNHGDITISGGSVSATTDADGKLAYGYYQGDYAVTLITGGTITGQHYGIYSGSNSETYTMTIGKDDGVIYNGVDNPDIQPLISGGVYGIYGGYVKFYDGRIRGGTTAHYDRNIKAVATNSYMHMTQETDYDEVKYVSATEMLAKIGNGSCEPATAGTTCYASLQAAIDTAQPNDTITLIANNYVFSTIDIPAEKTLTIELDGYTIIPTAHFTNAGNVTIQNSAVTTPVLSYHESDNFFVNTGTLTFKNISITTDRFVDNASGASLTLDNTEVNFEDHSNADNSYLITNAGTILVKNGSILTTDKSIVSQSGGQLTVENAELKETEGYSTTKRYLINATGGKITINKGKLTAVDTSSYSSSTKRLIHQKNDVETEIKNASILTNGMLYVESGTLGMINSSLTDEHTTPTQSIFVNTDANSSFDNCQLSLTSFSNDSNQGAIHNQGTLALTNGTKAEVITSANGLANRKTILISNSGNLTIDNAKATLNTTPTSTTESTKKYGIYNNGSSSVIHIQNGSQISVSNTGKGESYGAYVETSGTDSNSGVFLGDTSFIKSSAQKAYGVYVDNGKFVMGEKETDPLHIGEDIANKTDPLVEGISTTSDSSSQGYGVVHIKGIFNFYDGKIVGSTHSRSATITEVEYLYQAKEETDSNNNEVTTLQYMPNPSS